MKKTLSSALIILLLFINPVLSQDLNWASTGYVSGSLTHNFGAIGIPASTTTLAITGTPAINSGPAITNINANGSAFDCNNCALRTGVTFNDYTSSRTFTFTFNLPIAGLYFNLYDIDGDSVVVSASGPSGIPAVSIIPQNGSEVKIVGNGTNMAAVTGNNTTTPPSYSNQNANPNTVNISSYISTLTITYFMHQRDPSFPGTPSFSIGNMFWNSVLPINFVSVSTTKIGTHTNMIKWEVPSSASDNRYFVERSSDFQHFTVIGKAQTGTLTKDNTWAFSFTDDNFPSQQQVYRIKQVSLDNTINYSHLLYINSSVDKMASPFIVDSRSGIVYINQSLDNISELTISDILGNQLLHRKNPGERIDINSLAPNMYILQALGKSGKIYSRKIIKNF